MLHDSLLIRHWLTERAIGANRSTNFDKLFHLLSTCNDRGTIRSRRPFGGRDFRIADLAGRSLLRHSRLDGRGGVASPSGPRPPCSSAALGKQATGRLCPAFGRSIPGHRSGGGSLHPEGRIHRTPTNSGNTESLPTRRGWKPPGSNGLPNIGSAMADTLRPGNGSRRSRCLGFR